MLRKFVVILALLLSSAATQLYALGLGTVTVESSLNQPLRLRIEVLQLGDTRLQDITVSMASNDDFERFNIERDSFLSNVRFSVESTAQGNVIVLTSSQIVREPYLSFILDTRWPNGRLLSEHTVLFDLPVFNDQQATPELRQPISPVLQRPTDSQTTTPAPFVDSNAPAPVVPPSTASSSNSGANLQPETIAPATEPEPAQAEPEPEPQVDPSPVEEVAIEEQPAVVEEPVEEPIEESVVEEVAETTIEADEESAIEAEVAPEEPVVSEPETIETDANDTLSDIALQVRPDSSVTMQQTMLAIQELNPDAFTDGNINRLRSGEVLRVPSLADIQALDARDAAEEVTRQNQEFAQTDVQPLAAPSDASPSQDDQPQGQLSVVSSDEAIDASSGGESNDAENEALDQRIAELENQLAQRQEDADRARIEREELDSRMADLEEQIAAAQEIIRLQDIQLAQLQESLAAAAAEAQLAAEQQAIQVAAETESAQPVDSPNSLFDDVLRILTGNSIFMISGVVLVILLLVVLMLRRNRASKLDDDEDIEEIADQEFDAATQGSTEEQEQSEAEFEDYGDADLDTELDDIIADGEDEEDAAQAESSEEQEEALDVLALAEQLIAEQQYRRALSMLNTSLQEQGESDEVHAKIAEVEALLEEEAAEQQAEVITETAETDEPSGGETEAASFLDDLGIDLDSFDYEEDEQSAEKPADEPVEEEQATDVEAAVEDSDDVDMMFDLGGGDTAEPDTSEDSAESESPADDSQAEEETFEFDLDDDSNAVESEAKDPEDIEIDSFEFDADAADEIQSASSAQSEDEVEIETFSFDADAAASITASAEEESSSEETEEDPNAVDFAFDKDELADDAQAAEPASNDEVETFDFDLDDESDTVLEKPAEEATTETQDESDDFDFDLDEFDVDATPSADVGSSEKSDDDDDDFLDLDAEMVKDESSVTDILAEDTAHDDEIEFDLGDDTDAELAGEDAVGEKESEIDEDLVSDDDLEFLSDDDVEIESVDDVEEVDALSDDDESATKLELAYAYQKMGDVDGAKEILQEVLKEGTPEQIEEAKKLLDSL